MNILDSVLAALATETAGLDDLVAPLDEAGWRTATPSIGWDIAHQIAHLTWTDQAAVLAATQDPGWDKVIAAALEDPGGYVDKAASYAARAPGRDLLARWRQARETLAAVLRSVPSGQKISWFGPPMSATSMATARFMETWAHGLDVSDALGVRRSITDRIRHVVHLGVRTRDFAFATHGKDAPATEFRVELTSPSGDLWTFGPETADQRVRSRLRTAGHPGTTPGRRRPGGRRPGCRPLARLRAGLRRLARSGTAARMRLDQQTALRIRNAPASYGPWSRRCASCSSAASWTSSP